MLWSMRTIRNVGRHRKADLEAGMGRTEAAQHAERLGVARAPPQRAEPLVRLGFRIDQQEPD